MYPVICQIGPLTIYAYGVMLAVAVLVCVFLMQREGNRFGVNPEIVFDMVFWIVVGGLVGARIFFILLNWPFFFDHPSEIWKIHHGGLAWQGGLILGALSAVIFIRLKRMPFAQTLDFIAPYIALGQAIGRIGCFLNGCCYGREVHWGIYFPVHDARLHPTQLYSATGLFLIFVFLRSSRNYRWPKGKTMTVYLMLASALRFGVEFFRADHPWLWGGLSLFQIVALGIFFLALYANLRCENRK